MNPQIAQIYADIQEFLNWKLFNPRASGISASSKEGF
jgi:hypothetical protein